MGFVFRVEIETSSKTEEPASYAVPAKSLRFFENALCFSYPFTKRVVSLKELRRLRVKVVLKEKRLVRELVALDGLDLKKQAGLLKKTEGIIIRQLHANPELLFGSYDDSDIAFITLSFLYIDIVLRIMQKTYIAKPKFDDIDPQFGLHDFNLKTEIRSD